MQRAADPVIALDYGKSPRGPSLADRVLHAAVLTATVGWVALVICAFANRSVVSDSRANDLPRALLYTATDVGIFAFLTGVVLLVFCRRYRRSVFVHIAVWASLLVGLLHFC